MLIIPLNYRSFIPWNSLLASTPTYDPDDNFIVTSISLKLTVKNFMVQPIYNIIVNHNKKKLSVQMNAIPIWSLKYDGIILIDTDDRGIVLHIDREASDILLNQLHNNNFKEIQIDE